VARSSVAVADAPAKKTSAKSIASGNAEAGTAFAPVDELIHERIRLGIVSALAVNDSLTFREIKTLLQTSDGNLSVHARKLEAAGYVASKKSFEKRIPKTEYKLTPTGRRMFEKYLNHMETLIQTMRQR
jgi:DNA-binding HxlR family transcriptional regulator